MKKATHMGMCQICHAGQKLPKGHLSIHGYTVKQGWFHGTCEGSRHLPIEQSFDLVQKSIDTTKLAITATENKMNEVENSTDTYYYTKQINRKTEQRIYVETIIDKSNPTLHRNGEEELWTVTLERLDIYSRSIHYRTATKRIGACHVQASKKSYMSHLEYRIRDMHAYIAHQTSAIENWEPKPLTAI